MSKTPMTKWQAYKALRIAMADPDRLGDVAVLKGELGGARARPELEQQMLAMSDTIPDVDLDTLRALPRGTLGREYVELLTANGLHPFRLSGQLDPQLVRRRIFVARYGLVHDIYHVLTGFDTTWAGELGVWAFVAAQGYTRAHWFAVVMACLIYPLVAPLQIPRLWRNLWRGRRMGRQAQQLITAPFEQMWERPVALVRRELGIEPADELDRQVVAGVAAA